LTEETTAVTTATEGTIVVIEVASTAIVAMAEAVSTGTNEVAEIASKGVVDMRGDLLKEKVMVELKVCFKGYVEKIEDLINVI